MVYISEVSSTRVYPDITTRVEVFNHRSSLLLILQYIYYFIPHHCVKLSLSMHEIVARSQLWLGHERSLIIEGLGELIWTRRVNFIFVITHWLYSSPHQKLPHEIQVLKVLKLTHDSLNVSIISFCLWNYPWGGRSWAWPDMEVRQHFWLQPNPLQICSWLPLHIRTKTQKIEASIV